MLQYQPLVGHCWHFWSMTVVDETVKNAMKLGWCFATPVASLFQREFCSSNTL